MLCATAAPPFSGSATSVTTTAFVSTTAPRAAVTITAASAPYAVTMPGIACRFCAGTEPVSARANHLPLLIW